ncbi:hypothetical protein [Actinokineospora spheciospongiae]|uniref:hypothetical protein n=1 Tax=Actinokineospora spheciospongiae TaxID=909613 RepID=UPI000D7098C5|nr:hypothetical protein [Actinokineospora spheciospongiae]PWW63249.1 hypothetical protein DFQ13_104239 [Actinokineospora spheciospongiae]
MTGPPSAVDPRVRCFHLAPEAPARVACFPHLGTTAGLLDEPALRRAVLPGDHFHPVARQEAVRDVLPGTLRRLEVGR